MSQTDQLDMYVHHETNRQTDRQTDTL